jgi:hypothetical protein
MIYFEMEYIHTYVHMYIVWWLKDKSSEIRNLSTQSIDKSARAKQGCQIFLCNNYQNGKKYQLTNNFHCKTLKNYPNLGLKCTIWQPWMGRRALSSEKCKEDIFVSAVEHGIKHCCLRYIFRTFLSGKFERNLNEICA